MSGWKLSALALLALGAADLVALNVYFPEVWAPGEVPVPDDSVQPVSPGPPREPVAEPEEPGLAVEPVADDKADSETDDGPQSDPTRVAPILRLVRPGFDRRQFREGAGGAAEGSDLCFRGGLCQETFLAVAARRAPEHRRSGGPLRRP